MSVTGTVDWFSKRHGYGFIQRLDTKDRVFCHISQLCPEWEGYKNLYPGEYVTFDIKEGEDDKVEAIQVRGIGGGPLLCQNETYIYRVVRKRNDEPVNESQ